VQSDREKEEKRKKKKVSMCGGEKGKERFK
jgi:hypothetical protein